MAIHKDKLRTPPATDDYRKNYESIFYKADSVLGDEWVKTTKNGKTTYKKKKV